MWNSAEHSDQENLQWCWLRAVEWGRWPVFLSQPVAPVLLLNAPWQLVTGGFFVVNLLWSFSVAYRYVNVPAAYVAALFVQLRWIASPVCAYVLYSRGQVGIALVALLWPLLIFLIGAFPPVKIGPIQKLFMAQLGYEYRPT